MARQDFNFLHPFRVRYAEVDAQGIVFNAHYLTYFDVAITEYFRHLAFDYSGYVKQTGLDFHLAKSLVNYQKPIPFDAEIDVGCRTARIGNSSLVFCLEIFAKDSDDRFAEGEIVWVHTDQETHETVRVGDDIRNLISGFDSLPADE